MPLDGRPMGGGISERGECLRCGNTEVVLVDGTLCESCHPELWSSYEDQTTRFGLLRVKDGQEFDGTLVAVGVSTDDRAMLAWLHGPRSAEVYHGIEDVQAVYEDRENLTLVYH